MIEPKVLCLEADQVSSQKSPPKQSRSTPIRHKVRIDRNLSKPIMFEAERRAILPEIDDSSEKTADSRQHRQNLRSRAQSRRMKVLLTFNTFFVYY